MRRLSSISILLLAVLAIAAGAAAGETGPPTPGADPPIDRVPPHPCLPGDDCSQPPPPPPAPPPPNLDPGLDPTEFDAWSSAEGPGFGFLGTRCKTQFFSQFFKQLNLYNVIKYEGHFRVCYVPGVKVVSWGEVRGDATWVRDLSFWEWRGNEDGYPYGVRVGPTVVEFRYKGKAAVCLFGYGCGPEKHPWITLTFFPNNTMTRRVGVV